MSDVLRFGIESLDRLIGGSELTGYGIDIAKHKRAGLTTSLCLIGPDGAGKSVLALHLAAQYLADLKSNHEDPPKVLYISTDLTFSMAETVWDKFDLRHPFARKEPFSSARNWDRKMIPLGLKQFFPNQLNKFLAETDSGDEVCFVDLAQATAGDDWGFVHRMLSVLDGSENKPKNAPRHLVLLDAVEGFETQAGDLNAFGDRSTRRSRIAQVMRLAAKKCHLLFVVEEATEERLPEEFVTDAVIRLRNVNIRGYVRRTIEVEKTRGQAHVRGQHTFLTRDGKGSTTGRAENNDDPKVLNLAREPQSYVQILPSINCLSRAIMDALGNPRMEAPSGKYAGFGIPYLDSMLGGEDETEPVKSADLRGLPCSSVTALMGDALTQKSQLGRAFLSHTFFPFAKALAESVKKSCPKPPKSGDQTTYRRSVKRFKRLVEDTSRRLREAGTRILNSMDEEAFPLFALEDFRDPKRLVIRLLGPEETPLSGYLMRSLSAKTRDLLNKHDAKLEPGTELLLSLKDDFNRIVQTQKLYKPGRFADIKLSEATVELLKKNERGLALPHLNRALLEDAYRQELTSERVPGVAILMTTQDTHNEELAKDFVQWLNPKGLLGIQDDTQNEVVVAFEGVLESYIRDHTICRRMEIHDLGSPALAHIFQTNIQAAQRKLFSKTTDDELPEVKNRFKGSWRIRMVIDDFNAFRNTFPDVHDDPLLVPFLLFHFRREGISTLILDTQSGKPDIALAERYESSLREMADYRLYTWRIPFYGETRIAITAIPPISMGNRGLIRELRRQVSRGDDKMDRYLTIDPHFELYAGLERGHPHPVPLEVRLYPGTKTMSKYIETENIFFKELFAPNAGRSDIIIGFDPPRYEALRQFCYLQRDTRLDHTLVFQVDEFWLTWLTRQSRTRKAGVLQHQWPYLNAVTVDENGEPEPAADAYYLFQKTFEQSHTPKAKNAETARPYSRRDFYDNKRLGYGFDTSEIEETEIDRVPFCWDFSFLLCKEDLWREYIANKKLHNLNNEEKSEKVENVEKSWKRIVKAKGTSSQRQPVSWRNFLEACKEVADYHSAKLSSPIPAFDFSLNDGEAFSCLVLEIWLSEIYNTMKEQDKGLAQRKKTPGASQDQKHDQASKFAHLLSHKIWDRWQVDDNVSLFAGLKKARGKSLDQILRARQHSQETGYSLELYKTWLLLTEVVDFSTLLTSPHNASFEFQSRQSNPEAVAAHHWYQSACDLVEQHHLAENLVAVRLPGHFSVRGDWFLAAAGGSRSSRLAHRAMDLLGSRRANVKRLQLGIGLPVRKIVADESDFPRVRSRLISTDDKTGRLRNVTYKELLSIGGRTKGTEEEEMGDEFYWLWRSSLYGYARCSRVWQKWLNRMALWWQTIHARHRSAWTPGFDVYDQINTWEGDPAQLKEFSKYESWNRYHDMVDILLMEFQQVSFGHGPTKKRRFE
jgi:KaiC/GvpD/RAD55 family RecA-like ATPase